MQREAVMSDPAWNKGQYSDNERGPQSGMRIARKLGTITYRSAKEWAGRFARQGITPVGKRAVEQALKRVPEGFGPRFAVETYLEAQAEKFVNVFDPNCYLYLSRAHGLLRYQPRMAHPQRSISARGCSQRAGDRRGVGLPVRHRANRRRSPPTCRLPASRPRFAQLPSIEGHDAFLVDLPRFDAAIRSFLNG